MIIVIFSQLIISSSAFKHHLRFDRASWREYILLLPAIRTGRHDQGLLEQGSAILIVRVASIIADRGWHELTDRTSTTLASRPAAAVVYCTPQNLGETR
jgi:hypothetical protein